MNVAQCFTTAGRFDPEVTSSASLRWWIEHDCPNMRKGGESPPVRPAHYNTSDALPAKVLEVSSRDEEMSVRDYAEQLNVEANAINKVLFRLTLVGHLIRFGERGDYRYRRAS